MLKSMLCGKARHPTTQSIFKLTSEENSDSPCDTGSDLETIAREFPGLDFSHVDPRFPNKSLETPYAFTRSANIARGQTCLQRLYERPEKAIAVVSHSGLLRTAISKRSAYIDGQKRYSNHVVATWGLTLTESTLLCNCTVLDIC